MPDTFIANQFRYDKNMTNAILTLPSLMTISSIGLSSMYVPP